MELTLKKQKSANTVKSVYHITVETMEGDADDYHKIKLAVDTEEELKEMIIGLTLLTNAFPRGRGGYDDYCGKFFEEYISEELFSYEGISDSIESFSVKYINENGEKFKVDYTLDDEMKRRINAFDGLTADEIKTMEFDTSKPIVE